MDKGFGGRIETIAKVVGSLSALAKNAGISRRSLILYMTGRADPSRKRLIRLAETTGVNFEWLATGRGPTRGGYFADESYTRIPTVLDCGTCLDQLAACREFLQSEVSSRPEDLIMVRCQDHSMEPTIDFGSHVIVDKSVRDIHSYDIVCLRYAGRYLFKRVIRHGDDEEIILACDRYPQQKVLTPEEFELIDCVGKAVQVLKKLK